MHDQSANRPWWLSELLFLATIIPAVSRSFSISSQVVLGSWIILFTCLSGICGEHLVIVSLFWNYVLSTSGLWRQQSSLEPSVVQKFFLSLYHQYALQQLWRSWEISSVIHIVIFFLCDTLVMRHIGPSVVTLTNHINLHWVERLLSNYHDVPCLFTPPLLHVFNTFFPVSFLIVTHN